MNENMLVVLVSALAFIGVAIFVTKKLYQHEKDFFSSLPTIEEAKQMLATEHPGKLECFTLTKKVTGSLYGSWGLVTNFYGYFLECDELGISIRVRVEDQMS